MIHLSVIFLSENSLFAQDDEKSSLIGNPSDTEFAANIVADNAGNTYVGGQQNNTGLIVKQNALHVTLWSKALTFTTNPADEVTIGFMDLVGDTIFGCGNIHQFNLEKGWFFFKMNAQTGAMYWAKYELDPYGYFSSMRYYDGKFFVTGGIRYTPQNLSSSGKVLAVSSQTGNLIWETPLLFYTILNTISPGNRTFFLSSTEVKNGKFFITGHSEANGNSGLNNWIKRPILIGIDVNGNVFLEKCISLPVNPFSILHYGGTKIHWDADENLVISFTEENGYGYGSTGIGNSLLLKCDTLGAPIFCKNYNIGPSAYTYMDALHETASSYALFGSFDFYSLYVLKTDRNGNLEKAISISKPGASYESLSGVTGTHLTGNSTFINNKHYFVHEESGDINQVILNEDLTVVDDCSKVADLIVPVNNVSVTIEDLNKIYYPHTISPQNGFNLADVPAYTYCDNVSLDLVQTNGCSQATLQADIAGFINPVFYWSTGDTTTVNTLPVSSTDTVFLRVLDIKCCELIDTIVPALVTSSFTMSLPADTSVCLQPGDSLTITPSFSGANGVVQYLWSNNSTGGTLAVTASGTYWVDISDSCQTLRDSMVVTVNALPVLGNTSAVIVCEDDFPVTLNPAVSAGATVLWDDNTTSISKSVNGPGSYTIAATNSCGTVSAAISVTQTDLPDVQLISMVDTCIQSGGNSVLTPIFSDVSTVLWSDGSTGNQLSVSNSGSYTVYGSNACGTDSASCSVTIRYFPELNLPAVLDTCFDVGVGFSYTAQGSPGSYQWSSGSQTATEWISQEGIYSITLTNSCGSITDSMQVRRITAVDLYFPEDSLKVCEKQISVSLLQVETNYTLEIFAPDGDLVGTDLYESGWYLVHAFNPCGEKWDSIYVNLQNEQFFYLPNSFTPNNDGHNDRFEFKGENIVIRDVRIFNRWGEEIFTENGNFTGWDGIYRGQTCPDGIYSVHAIYEDCFGLPTEFSGHVNLIK